MGITIYIFAIIDCYTRQLKGYSFSLIKDRKAALKATQMAITESLNDQLFNPEELIWHSDQGKAYFTNEYLSYLKYYRVKISMVGKGKPTQRILISKHFSQYYRDSG